MKRVAALTFFAAALSLLASCPRPVPDAPLDVGATRLADWSALPELGSDRALLFSSRDREQEVFPVAPAGNKDFNNFLASCHAGVETLAQRLDQVRGCSSSMQGLLLVSTDEGPGYLARLWLTSADLGSYAPFDAEAVSFYVDSLETPSLRVRLADLGTTTAAPLAAPLAGATSGAVLSLAPVSFSRSLRVLLEGASAQRLYYHQANVQLVSEPTAPFLVDTQDEAWPRARALLTEGPAAGAESHSQKVTVAAAQRALLVEAQGPATWTQVALEVPFSSVGQLDLLRLRLELDGLSQPAVELPLATAFGWRLGEGAMRSLPLLAEHVGSRARFTLRLPVPFRTRAALFLENQGPAPVEVDATVQSSPGVPDGEFGLLHATLATAQGPFAAGDTFQVANLAGRGHYVGTVLYMEGRSDVQWVAPGPLNFLEGDERFVLDDERSLDGTGTEDYFDSGFYFSQGPWTGPLSGLVHLATNGDRGEVAAYRWHAPNAMPRFERSLRLTFEYGANRPATADRYVAVAWYYLSP